MSKLLMPGLTRVADEAPRLPRSQAAAGTIESTVFGRSREVASRPDEHLVTLLKPRSFEAERYRVLRQSLESIRRTEDLRVIAVSSPGISEGKTTTAINLSGSLAQIRGSRVLLIDADLRRPSVGRALGLPDGARGLADAAEDSGLDLDQLVRHLAPYNLSVMTAGRRPDAPGDVFESSRVAGIIEQARENYDFVVIDTPPLLAAPDCGFIEKWVDGFLILVAAHQTPRKLLEESLESLTPGKVLGLVLNKDERWPSGYSSYYRRYYEHKTVVDTNAG